MNDPMELVGRLEVLADEADKHPNAEVGFSVEHTRLIAACIREMVEKVAMLEDELEVANLPPAPGAEA